jgi:hypothetical protein
VNNKISSPRTIIKTRPKQNKNSKNWKAHMKKISNDIFHPNLIKEATTSHLKMLPRDLRPGQEPGASGLCHNAASSQLCDFQSVTLAIWASVSSFSKTIPTNSFI